MEGSRVVDLFATKGSEYLLVIGFLIVLFLFWRYLLTSPGLRPAGIGRDGWFDLPEGLFYHQGHSWAVPAGELVTVGVDDFTQKLVGLVQSIQLPQPGDHLRQGARAWQFIVDAKSIPMRSPVTGEVVAVNQKILSDPGLLNKDPYGEGWLIRVRDHHFRNNATNLLSGRLAKAWMDETVTSLRRTLGGDLGILLQDGGIPVSGIAKNLAPDHWDALAAEFLLGETPPA